jgi:phenylalanyl-tRNA synthetase beta subunit
MLNLYLTNNVKLGVFGQIHPILANKLNLSSEIYLFEFDVEVNSKPNSNE